MQACPSRARMLTIGEPSGRWEAMKTTAALCKILAKYINRVQLHTL